MRVKSDSTSSASTLIDIGSEAWFDYADFEKFDNFYIFPVTFIKVYTFYNFLTLYFSNKFYTFLTLYFPYLQSTCR